MADIHIRTQLLAPRFADDGKPTLRLNALQRKMVTQLRQKLADGTYPMETVACSQCSGTHFTQIAQKDRYGLPLSVVVCDTCDLVQTNPRMTGDSYAAFYNEEYRPLYVATQRATEPFYQGQRRKGRRIFETLKQHNRLPAENALVLEVGTGAGGILSIFQESGYRTIGVDLGIEYVEFGASKGLDLRVGKLSELQVFERPSLIIYSHVVEHLLDPVFELDQAAQMVAQGGSIYIEVPGIVHLDNYSFNLLRYLQNAHTFHFDQESLERMASKSGLTKIYSDEYIRSIWAIGDSSGPRSTRGVISRLASLEKNRKSLYFAALSNGAFLKQELYKLLKRAGIK